MLKEFKGLLVSKLNILLLVHNKQPDLDILEHPAPALLLLQEFNDPLLVDVSRLLHRVVGHDNE